MTPPPCTHNKNLNWKHHDDDDDIDELQAAMILTHLGESTTPSTSNDINATTDDDTTITVFHPVSPTSSITSSSPMMSISSSTNTKKHNRNIITPTLTSSSTELIEVARPAKKTRRHEVDRSSSSKTRRSSAAKPCVFPTTSDPEDISFERTLHSDDDTGKINSAHIHIRREVLEVKRSMSGRVYFQCGWCKHLDRKNRVKSSIIAPQNIGCIYRAFGRFMKDHVPKCMHIPTDLRLLDAKKTDIVRGSKEYWISSAKDIGLCDGVDDEGIIYCPPVGTPFSQSVNVFSSSPRSQRRRFDSYLI